MAKIIVNPTAPSRREIVLSRTLVSIGRDPSNDLVLPDAMVSRRHAVVEYRGSQYFLRDCNSSNGSLVNGDRVSERGLRDGDLVAIGTARLLFRDDYDSDEAGSKVVQHPSSRVHCPSCQAECRKGDVFCKQCGATVTPPAPPAAPPKTLCTACGTAVVLPAKFCNACGRELVNEEQALEATKPRPVMEAEEPPEVLEVEDIEGACADAAPASREMPPPPMTPPPTPGAHASSAAAPSAPPVVSARPALAEVPPPRPAAGARVVRPVMESEVPAGPKAVPRSRRPEPAELAAAGPRILAGLLDAVVVGAAQLLLLLPAIVYWRGRPATADPSFLPILVTAAVVPLVIAVGAVYYIYFWGVKGTTPAKRLLGLAVEGTDGTFPPGLPRAGMRFVGYVLSAGLLGVGFLMILFGGVGLHDRISDTRVVRRGRD